MIAQGQRQHDPHWEVTRAWFDHFDEPTLAPILGGVPAVRKPLYAASAGHHGRPSDKGNDALPKLITNAGADAGRDAGAAIEALASLFPEASLDGVQSTLNRAGGDWRRSAPALSWWFSGLLNVADWIGSNPDWFPATTPNRSIGEYWALARQSA